MAIKTGELDEALRCDICGFKPSRFEIQIGREIEDDMPCFCNLIKKFARLKKQNKKQREEIKRLKKEVCNLNSLLAEADEASWDQEGIYEDARDGTFNGNNIGGEPDKEYAKWLAERYNIKIEDED